jgi:hypothetical protein
MATSQHEEIAQHLRDSAQRLHSSILNPFSRTCDKVASARFVSVPDLAAEKEEVHIALVSLPPFKDLQKAIREYSIVQSKDGRDVDVEACKRLLVGHSPQAAKQLAELYESALRVAIEDLGANVVCLNELSFPSWNQEPLRKASQLTRELARKHRCLVVAGSTHDRRTLYNTSCLFYPGCPATGTPYHKQISATSIGELVSVPARRQTLCTRAFGLNIAVLICLDLADFSAVASVVKLADRVDVLLVPCYSEWMDSLEKVARAASAALRGVVALVNYRPTDLKAPCIVEEFGKPRSVDGTKVLGSGAVIHSLRIKPRSLQQTKLEIKGDAMSRLEWLFGAQNLEAR